MCLPTITVVAQPTGPVAAISAEADPEVRICVEVISYRSAFWRYPCGYGGSRAGKGRQPGSDRGPRQRAVSA